MPYYGLYIPVKCAGALSSNSVSNFTNSNNFTESVNDVHKENNETVSDVSAFVFQKKCEALQVLKLHKDARFKEFVTEEEAIKYAQTGFEIVQNKYNDTKTSTESIEKAAFRAPTRQQLIQFRQHIEANSREIVKKLIWDNPRYLVSSGDTPTILKEGYRYNAMHVCAISKCTDVAKLILDTVSDPKFAALLMGKKNDEKSCKELCANLLDYYLNMPEKGRNETPLHFASKFGHLEMVEILISYPECKMLRNIRGMYPASMICERTNNDLHYKISMLLEDRFYVPVLRSNDSAIPGKIGEPFSANNPPNPNYDPLTPELEIKALAGPMCEKDAKTFFRRWKTPPRIGSNVSSPVANNPFISPMKSHDSTPIKRPRASYTSFNSPTASFKKPSLFNSTPQRLDHNGVIDSNGFDKEITDGSCENKQNGTQETSVDKNECSETNNNNHLGNLSITSMFPKTPLFKMKNYAFSIYRDQNIASPIVDSIDHIQEVNDSLLNVSDVYDSPGFKERHVKITDIDKGLECIGRVLAREKYIEWREYWDFLEEFVDIASKKGMEKFENYLAQRQKEQEKRNEKMVSKQKPDILDDVCNALENAFRISNARIATTTSSASTTHQSTTPYTLYVEKSLQVHARRMTKTIIHNIDNEMSIIDALILELRRVKCLIYSFKEDASYTNVNFEKVHSRIGNLVSMFLENSQEVSKQMKWNILLVLKNISIEQDERHEHIKCVCSHIVRNLQHPDEQTPPENIKSEEMCSEIWSKEKNCNCQWESNLSRKTSRRNRMEARYQRHLLQKQQEKLQKDLDNKEKVNKKEEWRKDATNDSSDEDVFWSDFGGSDSEEDEVFLTPQESPSGLSLSEDADEDCNKIFIYGNEPTKRDLDVLNAIFHIDIDQTEYPNIHSWKATIMRYTNEEMDFFPSPRTVKKSHSFMATSSNKKDYFVQPQTPTIMQKPYSIVRSNTSSLILNSNVELIKKPILQMPPTAKRLFMSPGRTKSMTAISLTNNSNSNDTTSATITTTTTTTTTTTIISKVKEDDLKEATVKAPTQHKLQIQRPLTPLNKLRGLFSAYRECLDNSPLPSTSP